jgi:hypothetical protein
VLLSGVPVDVLHFLASLFRACLYLLLLSLISSCLSRFDVVVCRLVGVLGDVLHFLAFLSLVLGVLVGGLVVGLVGGVPGGLVGDLVSVLVGRLGGGVVGFCVPIGAAVGRLFDVLFRRLVSVLVGGLVGVLGSEFAVVLVGSSVGALVVRRCLRVVSRRCHAETTSQTGQQQSHYHCSSLAIPRQVKCLQVLQLLYAQNLCISDVVFSSENRNEIIRWFKRTVAFNRTVERVDVLIVEVRLLAVELAITSILGLPSGVQRFREIISRFRENTKIRHHEQGARLGVRDWV